MTSCERTLTGIGSLLKQSRERCPGESELTYQFLDWLAICVGDGDRSPRDLGAVLEVAIQTLAKNTDTDSSGNNVPDALRGRQLMTYAMLASSATFLLMEVLPRDFAEKFFLNQAEVPDEIVENVMVTLAPHDLRPIVFLMR